MLERYGPGNGSRGTSSLSFKYVLGASTWAPHWLDPDPSWQGNAVMTVAI